MRLCVRCLVRVGYPNTLTRPDCDGDTPSDEEYLSTVNGAQAVNQVLDIVGVGFGPSNLALAIAIEEHNQQGVGGDRVDAAFVESKTEFGWHAGMLLPGTTMQISFMKDLATQRNTQSKYSFISYLADQGRLVDFINHQTFFPTRLEFHDYLQWAASRVDADVRYRSRVVDVVDAGSHFEIRYEGAESGVLRARNVVLAAGLQARLPDGVQSSVRQFHNHNLLPQLDALPDLVHQRFVVVGAGQSAAEVVGHLHDRYRDAEVHNVFAKYGYVPADDSPYANRIFDPNAVDDFYGSDRATKQRLMSYHRSTNYSCVDLSLIEELYGREYGERVSGKRRLFMRGASALRTVDEDDTGVSVAIDHHPSTTTDVIRCDAVVFATGFSPLRLPEILGDLVERDQFDLHGPVVDRDYRLRTTRPVSGGIYLQGGTEHTHGLTSSLISNIAVRSGEILDSIVSAPVPAASTA